jgi:hypothetical protein
VQDFSGAVKCAPAAALVIANPELDEDTCPITYFPRVAAVVDLMENAWSDETIDDNGDKLPAHLAGGVLRNANKHSVDRR